MLHGKRLLMLGGSMQQIPAIELAKENGVYVVTCDYCPDNPGHRLADEYVNVSTTDLDAVLEVAREKKVDGVLAYASDPAAPTAAYVAEVLGLPGNPYEAVQILSRKDLFRTFQRDHGFSVPQAECYSNRRDAIEDIKRFRLPVMVKPVDSSGSKGVVKVERAGQISDAVDEAFSYSRSSNIIVEEFIEKKGYQVSGDGFSVDGSLVFTSFGNELYGGGETRDYVALGEFWPTYLSKEQLEKVNGELQRLITTLGMGTAAYNIEVILDADDNVYILELGPRNGGSYIPQLIKYATGVDLVDYAVRASLGESCNDLAPAETTRCVSNYMIMSSKSGVFKGLWFDDQFKKDHLLEVHCTYQAGDRVEAYCNTSHSLGTIIFSAESVDTLESMTRRIDEYFKVELVE